MGAQKTGALGFFYPPPPPPAPCTVFVCALCLYPLAVPFVVDRYPSFAASSLLRYSLQTLQQPRASAHTCVFQQNGTNRGETQG